MVKGSWIALGVLAAIVLVVLGGIGSAVGTYNSLNDQSVAIDAQGKQVDVAYQRAFRLVPQLNDIADRFMQNESEVQTRVAALRSGLGVAQNGTLQQKDEYSREVAATSAFIVDVVNERYPELRASDLYLGVMDEVVNTENKIAAEKVRYNDRVQEYNAHRKRCCMPLLVANFAGFGEREFIGFSDRPNQSSFPAGEQL